MPARSKTTKRWIAGTLEKGKGVAWIRPQSFYLDDNGRITYEHNGETTFWPEEQHTVTRNGQIVFVDSDGEETLEKDTELHDDLEAQPGDWLAQALGQLETIEEAAALQEMKPPDKKASATANTLIQTIHRRLRQRMHITPTRNREVVIRMFHENGNFVNLTCQPTGNVFCEVQVGDEHREARYNENGVHRLPDGFVIEATMAIRNLQAKQQETRETPAAP